MSFRRLKIKIRQCWTYYVGEYWCRRFHRPLFSNLGGYGGIDHLGKRRKEYYSLYCSKCNRNWEKNGKPKPLTPEQEKTERDEDERERKINRLPRRLPAVSSTSSQGTGEGS